MFYFSHLFRMSMMCDTPALRIPRVGLVSELLLCFVDFGGDSYR